MNYWSKCVASVQQHLQRYQRLHRFHSSNLLPFDFQHPVCVICLSPWRVIFPTKPHSTCTWPNDTPFNENHLNRTTKCRLIKFNVHIIEGVQTSSACYWFNWNYEMLLTVIVSSAKHLRALCPFSIASFCNWTGYVIGEHLYSVSMRFIELDYLCNHKQSQFQMNRENDQNRTL